MFSSPSLPFPSLPLPKPLPPKLSPFSKQRRRRTKEEEGFEITSSSKDEALFFHESHNWNLDSAVSSFSAEDNIPTDPPPPQQQINSPSPSPLFPAAMASQDKKSAKPSGSRAGGIRTLANLNRRADPDSDSDSDGPQEYYTGGEKRYARCTGISEKARFGSWTGFMRLVSLFGRFVSSKIC